jgi:outer membrane lipoprotein carrier protein
MLVCLAYLLLSLGLTGLSFAGDRLSDILKGVRTRYANLPGLMVPYQREIITRSMALLDQSMKTTDSATGRIFFKSPRFFMIQQKTPTSETIITDGQTLWWYIPEKKEAYEYPSNKLGKELHLLIDLFNGLREIEESFDVIQSDLNKDTAIHLTLIPNPSWEEIDHIDLQINQRDFQIQQIEIHNLIGGITRFILGDWVVQDTLTDDFFRFVVPEGVMVIKESG